MGKDGVKPMLLVDSHHHLFDLSGTPDGYPERRGPARKTAFGTDGLLRRDYTVDMYRADLAAMGATASVHIEAGRRPSDPVEETVWLSGLADAGGLPTAIVAFADLSRPDAAALLEQHAAYARVRGIRHIVTNSGGLAQLMPEDTLYVREDWLRAVPLLAKYGLSFEMQAPPTVASVAADVARRNPDVTFVLLHCGHPVDRTPDGWQRWRAGLAALAACPNVVVKLSGFYMMNPKETIAGARAIIDPIIDHFGPDRCMIASNFPVDRLFVDGAGLRAMWDGALANYTVSERTAIYGGTATRIYRMNDLFDLARQREN